MLIDLVLHPKLLNPALKTRLKNCRSPKSKHRKTREKSVQKRIVKPFTIGTDKLSRVAIRFSGDSGDGIQLTGNQLALLSGAMGESVITLSDFPAEIRPPAGTLEGVSAFQLQLGKERLYTAGDKTDVLVALNPAALKRNIGTVKDNGLIILNEDSFTEKDLEKAEYKANPITNKSLDRYQVFSIPVTKQTTAALSESPLSAKNKTRCKNFYVLGLVCWMFNRPEEPVKEWIREKFKSKQDLIDANILAFEAGVNYGDHTEMFVAPVTLTGVSDFKVPENTEFISGNAALSRGMVKGAQLAGRKLFLGGYPITPASDILHAISAYKDPNIIAFQAEDEIAAVGAAIGAAYAGAIGVTGTSGPGLALMSEFINLAVMTELPLVVVDVQRGGPSTGLPTKTEQSDLLQAMYGRNGESPVVVMAAESPSDCYISIIEAIKIATKYMTPVILMSDLLLANSSEPFDKPKEEDLPSVKVDPPKISGDYQPYKRDPETMARPWVTPGMKSLEHMIGGLEKEDVTGLISYDPENHQRMTDLRAAKVARVANDFPDLEVEGSEDADLLIIGWGSTHGAIMQAVKNAQKDGHSVACASLRYLNPYPKNLKRVLKRHSKVVIAENNSGQLWSQIRSAFLMDVGKLTKVQGMPFTVAEIESRIVQELS